LGKLIGTAEGEDDPGVWLTPVVIVGDLNVKADPNSDGTYRKEYNDLFVVGTPPFGTTLVDSWRQWMPPESTGVTQSEPARLDYVLLTRAVPTSDRPDTVTQHMRVLHRGISDHAALWAHIGRTTANCTPSDAKGSTDVPVVHRMHHVSSVQERVGAMRWIRFDRPGTYSWFGDDEGGTRVDAYLARDISEPWPGYAGLVLDAAEFGVEISTMAKEFQLEPRAHVFVVPEAPWYLSASAGDRAVDTPEHALRFGWVEHSGTSPADFLGLVPFDPPLDPILPNGQRLNNEDRLWCRVEIGRAVSGATHACTFQVYNQTQRDLRVALWRDVHGEPVEQTTGTDAVLTLTLESPGGEAVFLTVDRSDQTQTAIQVAWQHGLTYLIDDVANPLNLQCLDETGADWLGDDEIRLTITADGVQPPLARASWDSVDTGDPQYFAGAVPQPVAFAEQLVFEVRETGDVGGDDVGKLTVAALTGQAAREVKQVEVQVNSGRYRIDYVLARYPRGVG
jgi:hypothetical protein